MTQSSQVHRQIAASGFIRPLSSRHGSGATCASKKGSCFVGVHVTVVFFQACDLKAIDSYWPLFTTCPLSPWLRRDDPSLAVVVCSPGGASKSADDYDDYEYYSSADTFLPPDCFAASSFRVVGITALYQLLAGNWMQELAFSHSRLLQRVPIALPSESRATWSRPWWTQARSCQIIRFR